MSIIKEQNRYQKLKKLHDGGSEFVVENNDKSLTATKHDHYVQIANDGKIVASRLSASYLIARDSDTEVDLFIDNLTEKDNG